MFRIMSSIIVLSFLMASPAQADAKDDGFFSNSWKTITSYFDNDQRGEEDKSSDKKQDNDSGDTEDNNSVDKDNDSMLEAGNTGTPPTFVIPNPINIEATGLQSSVTTGIVTATDSLGNPITVISNAPITFPIGVTTVTYTATDAAGNVATTTQSVTVVDTISPVVTPPAGIITNSATGQPVVINIGMATATDIVSGAIIPTNNAPSLFPVGTTVVTWIATDAIGNVATANQIVTVIAVDTVPPTISIQQPAITIEATSPQMPVNLGAVSAMDSVDGAIVPTSNAPITFPLGVTTVTYTATDAAGNIATGQQQVTVQDTTSPVIALPSAVTVDSYTGQPVIVSIGTATATDAFSPVTIINDAPSLFPVGTTTVTWTATDANGNTAIGNQFITVTDPYTLAPLPADPGAAGLVTLAGIDSDNDGVRDDLQRWIALTYPNSQKIRAALVQRTKIMQQILLDAADPVKSLSNAIESMRAIACLVYVDPNFYDTGMEQKAVFLNTYLRSKVWIQADRHSSGNIFKSPSNNKDGCNFNPDIMLN